MRAKPQFRQHFSLIFLKIAQTVLRAVPGLRHFSALRFWGLRYFCACMRAKPQFRQHFIFTLFHIRAHGSARSVSDSFFYFFFSALFVLSFCRSRVLWVLDFCRVHAPETAVLAPVTPEFDFPSCSKSLRSPENPCPKHNSVRVPRAIDHQSIHAKTIVTFVFQSIHAKTIVTFVFQERSITRAFLPKP